MARDLKKPATEPEFDARIIRDLARLLEETGLSEIEIEQGGRRIKVARQISAQAVATPAPIISTKPAMPILTPLEPALPMSDLSKHPGAVTSPMVGTAFLAADPNSPPLVKIGDKVTKGQTLLIIDAMKTMNPIPAPRAGTVMQILVSNAAPVEYGQPMMIVE